MKTKQKMLSLVLAIALILPLILNTAYAFPGNYWWYPNNMHVRIYHPASGKYLGISNDGNEQNGARLQLQNYQEGNQLQIFYLKRIATDSAGHYYYQIRVHGENGKIIEVRNSSHDDWGEVAQWDEHSNYCAIWSFFTENPHEGWESPVCCIKNLESGKLMNVAGGKHNSGNNIIQYHEDGTSSEVFQIINVEDQIEGAIWTPDWNDRGIFWTGAKNTETNRQKYSTPISFISGDWIYYPHADEDTWYLAQVLYLDDGLQKKILLANDKDSFKTFWQRLEETVFGESSEIILDAGMEHLGLGAIPTGLISGIVDVIATGQEHEQWRKLVTAFQNNSNVRIEIYYKFKGKGWGDPVVTYVVVNDNKSTYWDGKKSSIDTTYYDWNGEKLNGSIEYFYK